MQRGAAGVTLLCLPGLLAACGGGGGRRRRGEVKDVLNFSNWELYIDMRREDARCDPTLDQFTQKTGIKVNYFEDINANPEYFGKVQGPLSQGQASTATSSS